MFVRSHKNSTIPQILRNWLIKIVVSLNYLISVILFISKFDVSNMETARPKGGNTYKLYHHIQSAKISVGLKEIFHSDSLRTKLSPELATILTN
jgi:hypothetical protein